MKKNGKSSRPRFDEANVESPEALGSRRGALGMLRALNRVIGFGELASRVGIRGRLGKSYDGDRDIYTALGWLDNPTYSHFMGRYTRQDVAKAVIDAPVRACWQKVPVIEEVDRAERTKDTEFEKKWKALVNRLHVFALCARADRVQAIGEYGVILMGFDDAMSLERPLGRGPKRLVYLTPYSMKNADIKDEVENTRDPRFGLPESYTINLKTADDRRGETAGDEQTVHWTRVIHVAEDLLESGTRAIPRLEPIFNMLQNLELVAGSSAEMFWRSALPGLAVIADPDAAFTTQSETQVETEMDEYTHELRRTLRLSGVKIQQLMAQMADPAPNVNVYLDLIAAAIRIPKRVLVGSERGELASTQDDLHWAARVMERQREHCEPMILRPMIDRLIEYEALPKPAKWNPDEGETGYQIVWPDLMAPGARERAEIARMLGRAIKEYSESPEARKALPLEVFLKKFLDKEEFARAEELLGEDMTRLPEPPAPPAAGFGSGTGNGRPEPEPAGAGREES